MRQPNLRDVPFISSIYIPKQGLVDESIDLRIEGSWPTPAWKHAETKIEYDHQSKLAVIYYFGSKKRGIAIQVIKNFTANLPLYFTADGNWSVEVIGRNKNMFAEIKINK
jgi:hypothetical protein